MKIRRDPSIVLLALIATVSIFVCPAGIASSFEEFFIQADVLEINATKGLNGIDTVTVKVVSLNIEKSYLCPYQVGQQILIEEVEIGDMTASDITPKSSVELHS